MRRHCQCAYLKDNMIEEYRRLHAAVWPSVLKANGEANIHNYSIAIFGNMVIAYFEYDGEDYASDMRRLAQNRDMQEWWKHTRPCFLHHEEGVYYEDLEEIFYFK